MNDPCAWPAGTASSGPRDCGKLARGEADTVYRPALRRLCGIHLNKAARLGWAVRRDTQPQADAGE
jgi:hypothetical protein